MTQIEKLKRLWNKQPGAAPSGSSNRTAEDFLATLRRFELRRTVTNTIKTIIVAAAVLTYAGWLILSPAFYSLLFVGGSILLLGSVTAYLVGYWRARSHLSSLDPTESVRLFLQKAVRGLRRQQEYFNAYFRWLVGALAVGMNVAFFSVTKDSTLREIVTAHGVMTILLLALANIGVRIRQRNFRRRDQVLIEHLVGALQAILPGQHDRNP